jgi:hypothetical protein
MPGARRIVEAKEISMRHLVLAAVITASSVAAAEPVEDWRLSVGVSPALAILRGGGIEADVTRGHARLFASVFTLRIPKLFLRDNADEGWSIRDTGAGLGAEYLLRGDGRGLFVGALLEAQNHHDERIGMAQNSLELGVAVDVGYRWMPWRSLYITPRLVAVLPLYYTRERMVGGEKLDEARIRAVPLLYTGWQF